MPKVELLPYHKDLAEILKSEGNPVFRKNFLASERLTTEYQNAKEGAKRRNLALKEISKQNATSALDEFSQESPVVGNPLVDVKPTESELTEQEKTILWANQILEQYNSVSKQTGREKKKAKNLVSEAAKELLQDPEKVDTAGSVWKSHEPVSQEESVHKQSFYELVKEESSHQAKSHWKEISGEKLTQIVKTYSHNNLVSDMAENILTSYFQGPDSRNEWISAYYTFAFAVLDLTEDQKAFNEAVKIGLFNTSILPVDSDLFRKANILISLPYDVDDRTLQKFLVAQNVIIRSSHLASEDLTESLERAPKAVETDSRFKELLDSAEQRAIKKLGLPKAEAINQAMIEANANVPGVREIDMTAEEILRRAAKWPSNLTFDQLEPLNQKFRMVGGPKEDYEIIKKGVKELAAERDLGEIYFLDIQTPDGFILSVAIPQALVAKRKEIIKLVLNHKFSEEEISGFDKQSHLFISHFNHAILSLQDESLIPVDRFDSQSIVLTQRKPNSIERNQHPLQSLETIGFPNPQLERRQEVNAANQEQADEIRKTQLRFLNKRGVRVPVKDTPLGDFGYSHIDFQKDPEDSSKTVVKISVGDVPYSVKLDSYFNFDFEGKKFNAPFIQDALRYTILSYLKPILCDETVRNAKGEESNLDAEVVSRMGHLMLLPSDRHRSVQAIVNCFRIEGKDLIALDAERREMRRKAGNRVPEDREYTYRKPVIEKEENLPPITINLPGVLRFRN